MLIGYNKNGEIKFYFTDEDYLRTKYPNNTAKISNFWGVKDHGLKELFVSLKDVGNIKLYKVINDKLVKMNKEEFERKNKKEQTVKIKKVKIQPKKIEINFIGKQVKRKSILKMTSLTKGE